MTRLGFGVVFFSVLRNQDDKTGDAMFNQDNVVETNPKRGQAREERASQCVCTQNVLPLFQKEVYTLLQEMYLKTPGAYRDSNYTIQN